MKWMTIFILASLLFFIGCTNTTAENHKDLDENMLDLMMYHDNLGLYLRMEKKDYALWLLNGLDSSLQVISSKFEQHRKLNEPFEQSYKKKLQPAIQNIKTALQKNKYDAAQESYHILTRKCNNCHTNLEINKVVVDRTAVTE